MTDTDLHTRLSFFSDIISYSGLTAGSRLIEIGVGTGQATLPFIDLGCEVIGIELGDTLCSFVCEKYKAYRNFKAVNADFMLYHEADSSFDLIYSATAFHWLPQKEALEKIMRMLKSGGTVALFWNHPFPNRKDDESNAASQRVYDKLRPSDKKQVEFCEKDCEAIKNELIKTGFAEVESKIYKRIRTLTTDEYIHLINTYSDHLALDKDSRERFEAEMCKAIDAVGGKINIYDTIDLYLAKKP